MTKKKAAKKKPFTKHKPAAPVRVRFGPQQKEFENALEAEAAAEQQQAQIVDPEQIRASQNRPDLEDTAAPAGLPDKAHAGLVPVLKIPFVIWSNIAKIPEIRLSDEEAEEWGLPVTQLLEYYFPGKIPEIAWVWLMFLSSTGKVIDSRVKIMHDKKLSPPSPGGPASSAEPAPGGAKKPKHKGAEVAEDFPQE